MSQVTVPVLKPLNYQGRSYVRGDDITLEGIEAAALRQSGHVTLTRGVRVAKASYQTSQIAADEGRVDGVRPTRRRYRRRDMTAEGAQ